ncbi:MAG: WG repeat-containing protein [Ekhidna sp.]
MLKKALLIIFIIPFIVFAGKLDRIKKAIEESDYEKAIELIQKAAEKEPLNPGVDYYQAFLYQTTTFKQYHLDSARIFINKSITDFEVADEKLIEELADDGIELDLIIKLKTKIRDKQFQVLLSNLSVQNVKLYRLKYPQSVYSEILDFKRDSIVFSNVRTNQIRSEVNDFIADYSTSIFIPEAREILDQLNYDDLTKSGKLPEYYQFLVSYPSTRFRFEVEEYILRFATLDHSAESYISFMDMCRTISLQKKAANLLYYLPKQTEASISRHPHRDSLLTISKTLDYSLFPAMDREKFGFITQKGQKIIDYDFDGIQTGNKCSTSKDDWIFVQKGEQGIIIDKLGQVVLNEVTGYIDLTNGAALITRNGKKYLYHKSGFRILEEAIDNAEVLKNRWIKITKNEKSELISFQGVPITETKYDDIYLDGSFWIFEKRGLLAVYTEKLITNELHKKGLSLEFKFEDIEIVRNEMFIGFRDNRECLLDNNLNFLIPWGEYTIYPDEAGYYLKSAKGYQLYNSLEEDVMDRYFPYLESNNGWLALKTNEDWMLLPRKKGTLPSRGYDSLKLINDFSVYTEKGKKSSVLFNNGNSIEIQEDYQLKTFPNTSYLSIGDERSVTIYNESGVSAISGSFDQITFLNDSLLKVEVRGKQGLMNTNGEFLLEPVFDVLDKKDQMIFLLDNNKIGCFDLAEQVIFMPKYESRLEKIGNKYAAKMNGKYGLFDLEEQPILEFIYDEIYSWDDSTFRVKKNNFYDFIDYSGESVLNTVELMTLLTVAKDQEIWKFVKEGKYGLISTRNGIILEPEFTDIFNIGSTDNPLYFADQHLSKAGFHVVSYVNKKGELIFSKAYTKQEFDKILCED